MASNVVNQSGALTLTRTAFPFLSFLRQYKNTAPNKWSFVLSAPDKGTFVAVGFSGKGLMIGSSAVVGWAAASSGGDGKGKGGVIKQYYLQGRTPEDVTPNEGRLAMVRNRSALVSHSGRLYLAFELNTDRPQPHLIYSVGYEGFIPSSDSKLQMHRDMGSRSFNYTSGKKNIKISPSVTLSG